MNKPAPRINEDSRPYWDGCNAGKLLFQRCKDCGKAQFYFRAGCRYCHGSNLDVAQSTGKGTIQTFSLVFRPPAAVFKPDCPYFIALIDLEEGFRLMANLPDADPAKVKIGAKVEVFFEARGDQKIPQFRLSA